MTPSSGRRCSGRTLVPGRASGPALVLEEPLSFWGGIDPASGRIVDRRHPQRGASVGGRVLLMPSGRGSSSGSSVLAECIRLGTAPAAVLLLELDQIVVLGALVAQELYGWTIPIVLLDEPGYRSIGSGDPVTIEPTGEVAVG